MEITCNIYATYASLHVLRFSDKMFICSAPKNVYDAYLKKKRMPYYVTVYVLMALLNQIA